MSRSSGPSRRDCASCLVYGNGDWSGLPPHISASFDRVKTYHELPAGEAVFRQGDPNQGVACVSSGVVGLRMNYHDGTEVLLGFAWPGDILGARAFLRNSRHVTSAMALTPAAICVISRANALRLTHDEPEVHRALVSRCLKSMDEAQNELLRSAMLTTRERLCGLLARLYRLAHSPGDHFATSGTVLLPVSRSDLAAMFGVQPETMSRVFTRLRSDGVIDFRGREVRVPSFAMLEAAAGRWRPASRHEWYGPAKSKKCC